MTDKLPMQVDPAVISPERIRQCAKEVWKALGKEGRAKLSWQATLTLAALEHVEGEA